MAKLEAYELQDAGLDTVEANHALGFKADCRDFSLPAAILRDLGIKVRLLSNNPRKASALVENGIELVVQLSCEAAPNPHSFAYLRTKKERMGHALSLGRPERTDSRPNSELIRQIKANRPWMRSLPNAPEDPSREAPASLHRDHCNSRVAT